MPCMRFKGAYLHVCQRYVIQLWWKLRLCRPDTLLLIRVERGETLILTTTATLQMQPRPPGKVVSANEGPDRMIYIKGNNVSGRGRLRGAFSVLILANGFGKLPRRSYRKERIIAGLAASFLSSSGDLLLRDCP